LKRRPRLRRWRIVELLAGRGETRRPVGVFKHQDLEPRSGTTAMKMNPKKPHEVRTSCLRVLVAEDGLVNRHLALRLLEREGHDVTLAANGEHALKELRKARFDVVLMDVDMPIMNGLEATRAIRARERQTGQRTPIVALTSNTNRDECFAAGMDAFLSKPLRPEALKQILGVVLSGNAA